MKLKSDHQSVELSLIMKRSLATLPLDPLRHFHEIALQGSLRRAADALRLTPPAITHSLAKLERALGVRLCERSRAAFHLTPAGKTLFQTTREMFKSLDDCVTSINGNGDDVGSFRVGIQTNLLDRQVDRILARMLTHFPRIRIAYHAGNPTDILQLVRDGDLQFGIGMFPSAKPVNLEFRRVSTQRLAYFVGRNHPLWRKRNVTRADFRGL